MAANSFYFLYQTKGGEDPWITALAEDREKITRELHPVFTTVLDVSSIPTDNDWTKVRYRGDCYFDFDADGDLELACDQFQAFLAKLEARLDFDTSQARLFCSGGKGFHCEIPAECFMPKVPVTGTPWLPYIFRSMAETLVVDTMDMRVYSGKRGRMWRTPNVLRDNGNYKVPITLGEALVMTPDSYSDLIKTQRYVSDVAPAFINAKFAMLFEQAKEKVTAQMRGKKKRQATANAFLDPWIKAKKHPPTIEALMAGTNVKAGAGFQQISMQLGIYATSVSMPLDEYLDRCQGLCEKHESDSSRYGSPSKRREELARMWRYFEDDNTLYDYDSAPIAALVKPGVPTPDLGIMETEDSGDAPARLKHHVEGDHDDGDTPVAVVPGDDIHRSVRKGFFMNGAGMWCKKGDNIESMCRASLRAIESFHDLETSAFRGYEFMIHVDGRDRHREMLTAESFTSASNLKRFFAAHQLSFQGGDNEATALMDILNGRAANAGKVYTYPREGFFVIDNPEIDKPTPVMVYLTKEEFISSIEPGEPNYFRLRYRPAQAISSYNIDIHRAPLLKAEDVEKIRDLFSFTRDNELADMLGWFVACHYHSAYLRLFQQFPLLQIYGEAGAGKSQTVWLLAHLHWYMTEISVKSAAACTPFAMDSHASTSTSAPFILDEFKPRELRKQHGKYEKIKDVLKATYMGSDIGERGTINRGAESNLAVVKSKATAPIVFMGEAIEMETAIIERSVNVALSKSYMTEDRKEAFNRLHSDPQVLSSLGREFVEVGFALDLDEMHAEVRAIQARIESKMPALDDATRARAAPRMIYNRAVIVHALTTLGKVLRRKFGSTFDADVDRLINAKSGASTGEESAVVQMSAMSEVSKVLSRIALLSRQQDTDTAMLSGRDYMVEDGWVEILVERSYDLYRMHCARISDTPLFDSVETFTYALNSYSPVIDRVCASSVLRRDGSSERVVRMSIARLNKEGVQTFR